MTKRASCLEGAGLASPQAVTGKTIGRASRSKHSPTGPSFLCYAELCWRRAEAIAYLRVRQAKVACTGVLSIIGIFEVGAGYQALLEPAHARGRGKVPRLREVLEKIVRVTLE